MVTSERPRCPRCGDVLIEGECIQHGVIDPSAQPRVDDTELVAAPAAAAKTAPTAAPPRAPAQSKRAVSPPRVMSPTAHPLYAHARPPDAAPAPAAAPPSLPAAAPPRTAAAAPPPAAATVTAAPPAAAKDDTVISLSPRTVQIAAAVGVFALLLALFGVWNGQRSIANRVDAMRETVDDLNKRAERLSKNQTRLTSRVTSLENKTVDFRALAKKVRPTVFTIYTPGGVGSGFVVESGGTSTLITNYHVISSVGEGGRVRIKQAGKPYYSGRVDRIDPDNDLASIVVRKRLPALQRTDDIPRTGDAVAVVGSPLGLGGSVTSGIVSGRRDTLIQFSAPVSPGNSGGPLVDRFGRAIGVTVAKAAGFGVEGVGFAIAIEQVCDTVLEC